MRSLTCFAILSVMGLILFPSGAAGQPPATPTANVQVLWSIDGATNPQSIPDVVAWRQFIGVLTSHGSDMAAEERRRRSYLEHYFGPGCGSKPQVLSDIEIDHVLQFVDDLALKLAGIHAQAAAIKGPRPSHQLSPGALSQLGELERQKNQLILDSVDSLPSLLGTGVADALKAHVLQHVKLHTKMVSVRFPTK
jgi:hypothetical protein